MPAINIDRDELLKFINLKLDHETLEEIVFEFGVELDDVYEENGKTMYKFDVPANRYDLLCLEGFATALKVFLEAQKYEEFPITFTNLMNIKKHQSHEREHIACAIIRDISFSDSSYSSFINYQDKLHSSIGRNRSIVAIGTHDLAKIEGQVEYKTMNLDEVNFHPLNSETEINGSNLEKFYESDKKISKFFNLLSDKNKCVAFVDEKGIMSTPPIINSNRTKICKETKDIFIEVTGTDFNKVNTALKLILYNFRGKKVESVKISGESEIVTPIFNNYSYKMLISEINRKLNINLSSLEIKNLLERMMHEVIIEDDILYIKISDARSDVLHECDIIEDIAISYGYNNLKMTSAQIFTVGKEDPLNKFVDKIRLELALSGYNEALTLTLISKSENSLNHGNDNAVVLSNPKSKEYEVVRTSLLPGILKSISSNLHNRIPIKIFEISDVVLNEGGNSGLKVKNIKKACAVIASNTALLEDLQGPLSFLFEKCGLKNYEYELSLNDIFLDNQNAIVKINNRKVGHLGVLHPSISQMFSIPYAASAFEIDVEILFEEFMKANK